MAFSTAAIPKIVTITVAWLCFAGCTSADKVEEAAAAEAVPPAVNGTGSTSATEATAKEAVANVATPLPPIVGDPSPSSITQPAPKASAPRAAVNQTSAPTSAATPQAQTAATPPAATLVGLPAGEGRETVQRVCGNCHAIDTVTAVGRTPQGWSEIISQMQNMGLSATDEDLAEVHAYLSRELPPR